METIKSYTDIEQSKKLAEILPIESADMNWHELPFTGFFARAFPYKLDNGATEGLYPCWSLAALLNVLPKKYYPIKDHETNLILGKPKDKWCVLYWDATGMQDGKQTLEDNPIDACVEMILKLHELKAL